uniref:Uncharacterized protein n=1 Tax=mine drainage metagenome TaxID=410659 RepID=E6QNE5_9ZZZZ
MFIAMLDMHTCLYTGQCRELREQLPVLGGLLIDVGVEDQNHAYSLGLFIE